MKRFLTVLSLLAIFCVSAAPPELPHRNCSSELVVENLTIRLKKSNEIVGFIRDNHVYTCFPFRIPGLAEKQVNDFINGLNGFIRPAGHYFMYSDGSCGYAEPIPGGMSDEEALKNLWNRQQIYKLFPEIARLCNTNVPFDLALHTVRAYPIQLRTPPTLDDIQHNSTRGRSDLQADMPTREFNLKSVRLKPLDFIGSSVDEDVVKLRQKIKDALYYAGSADLAMIYSKLGAAKGDAYAQYRLAWLMEEQLEQDEEVIFNLYSNAVSQNCTEAIPYLARCYWFGVGTAPDRRKAFEMAEEYLKKHPDSLHAKLLTGLWYFYETGEKDKGFNIISCCAGYKARFMPAQLEEALIMEFGLGGRPQETRWSNNFNPFPGETVHFWSNGYMLNARDRERWYNCGGGIIP